MADEGGASEGGSSRSSPEFGERIGSIETQLTQLTTLITSLVSQQGEGGDSSASVAAPGGSGPEAGTHLRDATGGTAGSTGRTQGLSMSSVGVGSTSSHTLGLNPRAFYCKSFLCCCRKPWFDRDCRWDFWSVLCSTRSYYVELSGGKTSPVETLFPGADISETGEFG